MRKLCWLPLILVLVVASPAGGQDEPSLSESLLLVRAIKSELLYSPVYVADGTENTDAETADVLRNQLNVGDRIHIAMLPTGALDSFNGDIFSFVRKVNSPSDVTAISVGSEIVAYSKVMPAGVAVDLMGRAVSVATSPAEALTTFIQNVHDWQRRNPDELASKSTVKETGNGTPWWVWVIIGLGVAITISIIYRIVTRKDEYYT